jgi:hypothetical protein
MKMLRGLASAGACLAIVSFPVLASAQDNNNPNVQPTPNGGTVETKPNTTTTVGEGQPPQALPPPRSYKEPAPPVAAPAVPDTGVTEQAGIGGTQAYGRAGVLELGGSMGFARASDFTQLTVSPSVGWFFMDNVQISGIVGFNYINAGGRDSTYMTVLAEPSFHIPFTRSLFGFFGIGAGLGYAQGPGAGLAVAPRIGMNIMVGRSGILTPALQLVYSTTEAVQTPQGTLLAVSTSFGANVGYTVMW